MGRFTNKIVVITGGTSGIGLATATFGASLVFVVCALVLLVQSQTTAAVGLLVFGSLVVFVADHFVRPILIGSSTHLPFLWVLLGIFGGLETFGLIGLFLGPAIMSVVIAKWAGGYRVRRANCVSRSSKGYSEHQGAWTN